MKTRLEANREIVRLLGQLVEAYPDWRFNQLLQNVQITPLERNEMGFPIGVPDLFYQESEITLENLKKAILPQDDSPQNKNEVIEKNNY